MENKNSITLIPYLIVMVAIVYKIVNRKEIWGKYLEIILVVTQTWDLI
jgi:hypothetical protein